MAFSPGLVTEWPARRVRMRRKVTPAPLLRRTMAKRSERWKRRADVRAEPVADWRQPRADFDPRNLGR